MLNTATIAGRLTRDPEIKQTAKGTWYASFSLANERGFGDNKKTNFFDVTVWGEAAQRMEKAKVSKGSYIYVRGNLDQQSYDGTDGKKHTAVKISVGTSGEWEYISTGKKPDDNSAAASTAAGSGAVAGTGADADGFIPVPDDDDLPF